MAKKPEGKRQEETNTDGDRVIERQRAERGAALFAVQPAVAAARLRRLCIPSIRARLPGGRQKLQPQLAAEPLRRSRRSRQADFSERQRWLNKPTKHINKVGLQVSSKVIDANHIQTTGFSGKCKIADGQIDLLAGNQAMIHQYSI